MKALKKLKATVGGFAWPLSLAAALIGGLSLGAVASHTWTSKASYEAGRLVGQQSARAECREAAEAARANAAERDAQAAKVQAANAQTDAKVNAKAAAVAEQKALDLDAKLSKVSATSRL